MFGAWRSIARNAAEKVMPAATLTWHWLIPERMYSTGSSTVMIFLFGVLRRLRQE